MKATMVAGAAAVSLLGLALPVQGHGGDVMKASGRVGPIQTGETDIDEMERLMGEPSDRRVVTVGCSKVIRLRWDGGKVQTYTYRADDQRKIIDVKVNAAKISTAEGETLRFHTKKGLRVGDSHKRLKELYPNETGHSHRGHVHYLLHQADTGTNLLAKVVDDKVVQLEAAPYEYC